MKLLNLSAALILLVASSAQNALAFYSTPSFSVSLATGSTKAGVVYGNIKHVASLASPSYLYCSANSNSSGASGFCSAKNSSGVSISCSTTNANMIAAIRSISWDSTIYFQSDANGNCTQINVTIDSRSVR